MAIARRALVGLAWLFLAGVVLQFLFAGLGMPQLAGRSMEPHIGFGYAVLHLYPILMLIVALVARAPRPLLILAVVLATVTFVQPIWVSAFRGELLAALHSVGGAAILVVAHAVARRATALLRSQPVASTGAR